VPLPARFCSANDYSVVASTAAYGNWAKPPEGLWGVTVCARKASVMPSKAETGLALGKRNQALRATERIGPYPDIDALDIPVAKLNTVEGEGRIVVLDCKVFVLISVYVSFRPGLQKRAEEI
jgi:exonuclease III